MCAPEKPYCSCATVTTTTGTTTTGNPVGAGVQVDVQTVPQAGGPDVLTAAADDRDEATGLPRRWHGIIAVEGLRTTDHRAVARDALSWRQLPLAWYAQFDNDGHRGASIVGSIETMERRDDMLPGCIVIYGTGTFDLGSEDGREAARMCDEQILRWCSMDLEVLESQLIEVGTGSEADMIDILFGEEPEGESDWYEEVTNGRIMGATEVGFPAFPQCVVAPIDRDLDIPEPMGTAPMVAEGLMAAGLPVPETPPAHWFADPELPEATPLTVDSDGRVYGHLALWGTCHTGIANACVRPPKSGSDYAYFRTGEIVATGGERVRVGQITFDTGHAGAQLDWRDTTSHYDHTGTAAADVAVGEDEFGIWFAGSLRPGLSGDELRTVRASALSGDWRKIAGKLELVAALAVNVPGYPIVASAGKRGDEQVSLVAAGVPRRDPVADLAREFAQLRQAIAPLLPLAADQLRARVAAASPPASEPISLDELRARINNEHGGKPSKGTAKDKRLKKNKQPAKVPA